MNEFRVGPRGCTGMQNDEMGLQYIIEQFGQDKTV